MIDGFLLKRKALKSLHNKRFRTLPLPRMPAAGLEPARGCPRQILSLMRLPFRHSCVFNSCSLSQFFLNCKYNFGIWKIYACQERMFLAD